jgi:hypothetical protein
VRTRFQTNKENRKQKVLPKLSIPVHDFDMILIDLSKILRIGARERMIKRIPLWPKTQLIHSLGSGCLAKSE